MNLERSFQEILQADIPTSFEMFGKILSAKWIESALRKTGTASIRRRKLSSETLVWLVIG